MHLWQTDHPDHTSASHFGATFCVDFDMHHQLRGKKNIQSRFGSGGVSVTVCDCVEREREVSG